MLEKPWGPYHVGICHIDTDTIGKGSQKRRIPMTVFFPSDETGTMCNYETGDYYRMLQKGNDGSNSVVTYCYENVPLSKKHASYPVLMYSHGFTAYTMDSTKLCADLASYGYIIFSVGHPYGADMVRYTDGSFFEDDFAYMQSEKSISFFENFKLILKTVLPLRISRKNAIWNKYTRTFHQGLQALLPLWEEDMNAAMNYIEQLAVGTIDSMFYNHLDLTNGFGMMGMSLGGCISTMLALKESRIAYGINIDGGLFMEFEPVMKDKPILVICEQINVYSHMPLKAQKCTNVKIIKFHGVKHWEMADGTYLSEKGKRNKTWADELSKKKCNICLDFIDQVTKSSSTSK